MSHVNLFANVINWDVVDAHAEEIARLFEAKKICGDHERPLPCVECA